MTFLNIELYEALKAAKVPEDKAKAAATSVHQTDQAALKALLQKEFAKLATKGEVSAAISKAVANLATKDEVSAAVANLATKEVRSNTVSNLAMKDAISEAISDAVFELKIWILGGLLGVVAITILTLVVLHPALHSTTATAEVRFRNLPNEIYPIKIRLFPRRQTAAPPAPAANLEQTLNAQQPNAPE